VIDSDGWLHSGDIGELDRDGFLFIRGRVKNILLTASGMNVYPEDIEAELLNHRAIRDAVALISTHKGTEQLTAVLLTDLDEGAARAVVKEVNQSLASHQAIARVVIWPDVDFPRTPTRKVKRREVQTAIDREAAAACTAPAHDADMLHAIIREVSPTAGIIEPHSLLASDLGIDSIKRLELITFIEERLLVVVDEASLSNDTTVGDLVRLIDAARGAGSASAPKRAYGWLYALPVAAARSFLQALLLAPLRLSQRLSATSPLPLEPPAVFIANHTSHLDSLTFLRLAGYRGRRRLIVAAAGDYFFATRVTGFLSRFLVNAVPIDRTGNVRQSLDMIGHHLDAGRSVAIFPEGTRSPTGRMQSFKPGIGLIAQALEVPIIPVRLEGNFEQWPKGTRWPRRGSTVVRMGGARRYSVTTSADTIARDLQRAVERL